MTDLLGKFADAVNRFPDRAAIVNANGQSVSFLDLQRRSRALAATWAGQGITRGDRVLLAMGISSDLYASLAALWSLGATVVLPEPAMGLAGLRHAVKTAKVKAFCATGGYAWLKVFVPDLWNVPRLKMGGTEHVAQGWTPDLDDIALISFTSGTTGAPKAIPRSHGFLLAQNDAVAPLLDSAAHERDLVAFPVFALINLAAGRTSVLPNWKMSRLAELTPKALHNWITAQNVTRALLPPSLCEKLGQSGPIEGFHHIFTGGGPVFPDTLDQLKTALPETAVTCVYGSTEAEPIAHLDRAHIATADFDGMREGAGLLVGQPTETTQVQIVDDEILVAGDHVNQGYLDPSHDADNKIHDGAIIWHRTGDAGRFDDTGRLWLLGRMGSDIIIDAKRVFPFSIEVAVRQWDGVTACALVAKNEVPVLAIAGDGGLVQDWQTQAAQMGIKRIQHLDNIPMDRRHASKVDRVALLRQIEA